MLAAGLLAVVIAAITSFAIALLIRHRAAGLGLIATPNARSSHTVPTPSGGGIGIVAGGSIGVLVTAWSAPWPALVVAALAVLVAGIGLADDRNPLPAAWRLVAQLVLVTLLVAVASPELVAGAIAPGAPVLVVAVLLVLAITYWLNIFNFMDGIDGIATLQAAFMLGGAILLSLLGGADAASGTIWWFAAIAAASLGFAVVNFPPARIFMGDAGSTYLGFMLGAAGLLTIGAGWMSLWQWLILGALFIADPTITLVRRLLRREPVFEAHRLHAYQHLSRRWGGHRPVTLLYLGINIFLLLPLAAAAGALPEFAPVITILAYVPVVVGLMRAGAGALER